MSVWIDNQPEQRQQLQQQDQQHELWVSESSATRQAGGDPEGSAFSRRDDGTVDSHVGDVLSPEDGRVPSESRSASPPPGIDRPSSIVRRISDKGGGSLPGSPTRGGTRYGRTDQLVSTKSLMSVYRS